MNDDLVLDNIKLIYYVIKKMELWDSEDLYFDAGMIGLVKAANNFDPDKGYTFGSFAVKCIQNAIIRERSKQFMLNDKANWNTLSLDMPMNDGEGEILLGDCISDGFDLEEEVIKREEIERLRKAISTLSLKEQILLDLTYGDDPLIQAEIAKIFHTTQSNISRRLSRIYKKLRKIMEGDTDES